MEPSQSVIDTYGVIDVKCNIQARGETHVVDVSSDPVTQARYLVRKLGADAVFYFRFPVR